METILPAYKALGERRYRETSGLYWEDFEPGDVFEHRPGRTVLDVDNTYFTLLTLNVQPVHFDAARAGPVPLNSFRGSISFVLPGLRGFLPHRGWDAGRAKPDRRSNPYAAAEISCCGRDGLRSE